MGLRIDRHLRFRIDGPLGSEAGTGDDDYLSAVIEPVQTSRGQQRVSEQIGPFFWCAVAGKKDAAALITGVDDIVEIFRGRGMERFKVKIVQHQQIGPQIGLKPLFQSAIGAPTVDLLRHAVSVDEQRCVTFATGLVGQMPGPGASCRRQ